MNMKKAVIGLMTALSLSLASVSYADPGIRFGIVDDLTVYGTNGAGATPDVGIKGFTVFGTTQAAPALNIPAAPGNIFVNGYIEVSSGMYVAGSSTFTAGFYSTGISSFAAGPGSIYISGGGAGQVLKKVAGGGMEWLPDSVGLDDTSMGDPRYLQMPNAGQTALENSKLYQNLTNNSITLMDGSSMTVTGAMGVTGNLAVNATKFQVTAANGNTSVGGTLGVLSDLAVNTDKFTVAALTGNTGIAGTLGVLSDLAVNANKFNVAALTGDTLVAGTFGLTGAATLESSLLVKGNARLGDAVSDYHGINTAPASGTALKIAGANAGNALEVVGDGTTAGNYVVKFYSGGTLAAWIVKE